MLPGSLLTVGMPTRYCTLSYARAIWPRFQPLGTPGLQGLLSPPALSFPLGGSTLPIPPSPFHLLAGTPFKSQGQRQLGSVWAHPWVTQTVQLVKPLARRAQGNGWRGEP